MSQSYSVLCLHDFGPENVYCGTGSSDHFREVSTSMDIRFRYVSLYAEGASSIFHGRGSDSRSKAFYVNADLQVPIRY